MRVSVLILLLFCPPLFAQTQFHRLFTDNAILQRDTVIPVTGTAPANTPIVLYLDNREVGSTTANAAGRWQLNLPAQQAGGPHQLRASGETTATADNILFGDVWLVSGQSNMELTMARVAEAFPEDLATAHYQQIREFTVTDRYDFSGPQQDYTDGQWRAATQAHIANLSAVAFYFARELYLENGIPIGIVNASLGGSPIEAWMGSHLVQQYPAIMQALAPFKQAGHIASITAEDTTRAAQWQKQLDSSDTGLAEQWYRPSYNDTQWQQLTLPGQLPEAQNTFSGVWWARKTFDLPTPPQQDLLVRLGRIVDADEVYINGEKVANTTYQYPPRRYLIDKKHFKKGTNLIAVRVTSQGGNSEFVTNKPYFVGTDDWRISLAGPWRYKVASRIAPLAPPTFVRWQPTGLYNAMIAPAIGFPLSGAVWYQGESNAGAPEGYADKLVAMAEDWRASWQQDWPFLTVQLTNFMARKLQPEDTTWAQLRHQQMQASQRLDNAATIVTLDIGEGNDIHPVNKAEVGRRLALAAQHLAYADDVDYQGPVLSDIMAKQDQLIVIFEEASLPMQLANPEQNGFAIAGADGIFHWAKAQVSDQRVILTSPDVSAPTQVRYGWGDNPAAGLFDSVGLPAAPFSATLESSGKQVQD